MRLATLLATATALLAAMPLAAAAGPGMGGDWVVDLSAKLDEPYIKPMILKLNADGTVTGEFYQSTIEAGRWKTDRGRTCVSFRTSDGVGPYHTAACLVGDRVEGHTWAEQRNFVFNWNATRKMDGK